ncbi:MULTISPECIES: hypothetical protein [Mycolicibacterium]|jgi:hypothetical protein|nr:MULTISPECIES: hypothetical protein [Mycolicibacterium]CRL81969.1 transmembrane protein [Mycolicibacter nonchromogenicus]AMD53770.1 hypothetical protein ATO49_02475 [Mycolicibacterium fortuitum subsp. fortuitum DSM 46621 = ATCC 6841 = JCM 6387]EJZ08397.1 hypothetical protein MFORT_24617 [Mycolicibacterium fortuitum subsp. fortuitum DSM 46621 = ATCC 6841 = JCM 6387]MBP3082568.1 hypothetical protein [Mycolicibacterium fortuitum]MCA4724118.1 hypothetical protein [Mycolicibacterium fortuitum]
MGSDEDDVEKRWHNPQMFRSAVGYVVAVVVVAAVALTFYAFDHSTLSATLVPTILFVGGLGAFLRTYQVWKAEGTWPIWQGAGWFLLALSLVCLAVPGSAVLA